MFNYVTFETAKKLKEAGFPQPEPFPVGQVWYCLVYGTWFPLPQMRGSNSIYAPTATELLLDGWSLVRERIDYCAAKDGVRFTEWVTSPAEAAASAWLNNL